MQKTVVIDESKLAANFEYTVFSKKSFVVILQHILFQFREKKGFIWL